MGGNEVILTGGSYNIYNLVINGSGTLVLNPGTYNVNCITLTGGGNISIVAPSGSSGGVMLNVAGSGCSTPIDLSGGTFANNTGVAANFLMNYAGSGTVSVSGGAGAYMAVYAPSASVNISGGTAIWGALVGAKITDTGGASMHYDANLGSHGVPISAGGGTTLPAYKIAFRELMY